MHLRHLVQLNLVGGLAATKTKQVDSMSLLCSVVVPNHHPAPQLSDCLFFNLFAVLVLLEVSSSKSILSDAYKYVQFGIFRNKEGWHIIRPYLKFRNKAPLQKAFTYSMLKIFEKRNTYNSQC